MAKKQPKHKSDSRRQESQDVKSFYPLPKDLSEVLAQTVENPVLAFHRFVAWRNKNNEKIEPDKDKAISNCVSAQNESKKYISEYRKRLEAQLDSLKVQGYIVECLKLKTDSRLIAGLGAKGALEVGITLHHLYGFPYIPSSAVKGICRAFAEQIADAKAEERKQIFGSESKDEKQDSEKQLGVVVFLDAIPMEPKLEKDIMNPHYSPYYSEKKIPGDWHSPVPIFFLAVPAGTEFWFGLAADSNENLQKAKKWLIGGLSELGAGAKTSSGYGFFKAGKTNQENAVNQATQQDIKQADVTATAKKPNPKPQGAVEAIIQELSQNKIMVKVVEGKFGDQVSELRGTTLDRLKNLRAEVGDEIYVRVFEQKGRIQSISFSGLKYQKEQT